MCIYETSGGREGCSAGIGGGGGVLGGDREGCSAGIGRDARRG